ncbi:serine hydrolase domain-containing protein [Sutcliffiella cohnii]|uniref:serine hydrolase domain-containing protein n=1 Tax=Sutcliffiella cohnii TaxID=33932 RepID=UPI002E1B0750|nr:serine hydrolase [Sutcliffiella cohnii]
MINKRRFVILIGMLLLIFLLDSKVKEASSTIDNIDEKIQLMETEIENNMHLHNIPGMAFALVDADGVIYSKGFGLLKVNEQHQHIDEETNFHLGSLSKVFTSIAILQLEEKGLIDINKPVVNYLPWFTTKAPEQSDKITVEHLLQHSSGLPGRLNVHDIKSRDRNEIQKEIVKKLTNVQLVGNPGELYEYTNMNTDLLQVLIEEVTGEPFTDYMYKNIFSPLQMERTTYHSSFVEPLPNTATGHRYHFGKIKPYEEELVPATAGSAGLSSNVKDLAHFMTAILNDGKDLFADSNSIPSMFQPNNYGVGYNWYIYPHNMHMDGGLPSFTSTMVLASDKTFGLVLLSNSNQEITLHTGFNLYKIVEGEKPTPLTLSDFPKINSDVRIIIFMTVIVIMFILYLFITTSYGLIKGSKKVVIEKLSRKRLCLIFFLLTLYLGVLVYIYKIQPFYIGVPKLLDFKKEPDTVTSFLVFSVVYSLFTLLACLRLSIIKKAKDETSKHNKDPFITEGGQFNDF